MAFCQNCGTQLNEGSKFCPNCGTPMQMESGAASALQEGNPVAVEAAATEPMQAAASSVAVLEKDYNSWSMFIIPESIDKKPIPIDDHNDIKIIICIK